MSVEKLSGEKLFALLSTVPDELRKLAARRDELEARNTELEAENSQFRLRDRCTKLAQRMHEKGYRKDEAIADIVEDLVEKKASRLDVIEESLDLSGPNMSLMGSAGDQGESSSGNRFIDAIMNG